MRYKYNLEEPKIIYLLVFVTNIKPVLMKCKRCKGNNIVRKRRKKIIKLLFPFSKKYKCMNCGKNFMKWFKF